MCHSRGSGTPCHRLNSIGPHFELKRLFEDARGVIADQAHKLSDILARLDAAGAVAYMDLRRFAPTISNSSGSN